MSARTRIFVIAGAAAAVAAGATVALAVITSSDEGGQPRSATPLAGAPPLVLDLGVRIDPEARALRRAWPLALDEPWLRASSKRARSAPRRGQAGQQAMGQAPARCCRGTFRSPSTSGRRAG